MWPCNPQSLFMETKMRYVKIQYFCAACRWFFYIPGPHKSSFLHTIRLIPRTVPQLREDVQTEKLI